MAQIIVEFDDYYVKLINCIIRRMSASDSEPCRPPNPKHVGHPFRTMAATF
jgi:hypothetical protein